MLVTTAADDFHWGWLALYLLLPPAIAALLQIARQIDHGDRAVDSSGAAEQGERGTLIDFLILAVLGLAVDLRWFERAWPPHMSVFNKVLLLDAGIYGFVLVRRLGEQDSICGCACGTPASDCARWLSIRRSLWR